jgi:hypothetical protein
MTNTTFFAIAAVLILASVRGWLALAPNTSIAAPAVAPPQAEHALSSHPYLQRLEPVW